VDKVAWTRGLVSLVTGSRSDLELGGAQAYVLLVLGVTCKRAYTGIHTDMWCYARAVLTDNRRSMLIQLLQVVVDRVWLPVCCTVHSCAWDLWRGGSTSQFVITQPSISGRNQGNSPSERDWTVVNDKLVQVSRDTKVSCSRTGKDERDSWKGGPQPLCQVCAMLDDEASLKGICDGQQQF
jgi:hypothetical protein